MQERKISTYFPIQNPPSTESAPVVACFDGAANLTPFITRVPPPDVNDFTAIAIDKLGRCPQRKRARLVRQGRLNLSGEVRDLRPRYLCGTFDERQNCESKAL